MGVSELVADQDPDHAGPRLIDVLIVGDLPGRHRKAPGEFLSALLLDQEDRDVHGDQAIRNERDDPRSL